jgi:hypothetical protein
VPKRFGRRPLGRRADALHVHDIVPAMTWNSQVIQCRTAGIQCRTADTPEIQCRTVGIQCRTAHTPQIQCRTAGIQCRTAQFSIYSAEQLLNTVPNRAELYSAEPLTFTKYTVPNRTFLLKQSRRRRKYIYWEDHQTVGW